MHWGGLVLLPADAEDIDAKVTALLAPYDLNVEVEPHKAYFSFHLMNGWKLRYGTSDPAELAELIINLRLTPFGREIIGFDEGGVYRIDTFNTEGHWDYWQYSRGYWMFGEERWTRCFEENSALNEREASLRCNMGRVEELLSDAFPLSVITPDGMWHDIDDFADRTQLEYEITDAQRAVWEKHFRSLFSQYHDYLAISLDFHS